MESFDAEVVTIGDELNRGEIVDTNSSWLAERLTDLGLHVRWRTSVTDDERDLAQALTTAARRARVVLTSGGLGPTEDDRTVDVVAQLLDVTAVPDALHRAAMLQRYAEREFPVAVNDLRQVQVPAGAQVLANRHGVAPGFGVRLDSADLYCMPGIPREMKPMFAGEVQPRLAPLLTVGLRTARRTWRVAGKGESYVDRALTGILDGIPDATLHLRILFPEILVTIVVRRGSDGEAATVLDRLDAELRSRLGVNCYGLGDDSLAAVVGERLRSRGETIAVAESGTGGLIARLITCNETDPSKHFRGGWVGGSTEARLPIAGAEPPGNVMELAEAARAGFGATWGAAALGGAARGGTEFDVAIVGPDATENRHFRWPGELEPARQIAAFAVLHLLYRVLDG